MHENQLSVSVDTVHQLIGEQFPAWGSLPIVSIPSEGTVNAIFRIGDGLAARFPLLPAEIETTRRWLQSEAAAGRELLGATRFPIPEPVAIGEPGAGYPLPWSVQTWLPGTTASEEDPAGSNPFARDLGEFIQQVRSISTGGRRFDGKGRGGDLQFSEDWMETCFQRSDDLLDVPRLRLVWARIRELPREAPDVMTHGDLIPGNVLVADGRLAGILDVGGLGPADPALDLVGAWHLLDTERRGMLRAHLDCGDLEWERGKAWAFQQAMGAAWYYRTTNRAMHTMGLRTLKRILADE